MFCPFVYPRESAIHNEGKKKAQTISFLFMLSSFRRTKSSFHLGFLFLKFISFGKKNKSYTMPLRNIGESGQEFPGSVFVCSQLCFCMYVCMYYYYYYFERRSARTGSVAFRTYVWALPLFLPPSLPHCLPHFRSSGSLLVSDVNGDLFLSLFCPLIPCSSDLNTTGRIYFFIYPLFFL